VLIGHDEHLSRALEETRDRLSRPGALTLYEATFDYDGVLIRADIFSRVEDGTCRLVEVKAATKLKEYYLYDCAIQLWVLENLGYQIDRLELAHVNNQFIYAGGEDYEGLLTSVDVLDQARSLQAEVVNLIDSMRDILRADEPDISMGKQCTTPFECPAYKYCLGPQPEMPVSWLPGGKTAANKLIKAGYKDIRDIPEGYLENNTAEMCRKIAVSGKPKLDSQAAVELQELAWPRYYFDFETMAPAVPVFPGTSPYKAQAFQWSCHIEHQNGEIEHREFLADGREAPMRACAESLIDALGIQGPIFMYTSYERTTINGFIALFSDLAQPLESVVDRLYDLHPLTRKNFYHPDMHGSWSIKAILPAVAPDLKYDDLDIVSNGAMAEPAFLEMIDGATPPARREDLREALLRYCELDTLAMVRLAHYLEGRVS
jgi:hypothetical protein